MTGATYPRLCLHLENIELSRARDADPHGRRRAAKVSDKSGSIRSARRRFGRKSARCQRNLGSPEIAARPP